MKAAREQLQALGRSARCAQAGVEKTCIQLADLAAALESSEEEILHAAIIFEMKQTYIHDKINIVLWEFPGGLCASGWGVAPVRSLVGELIPQTVPPPKKEDLPFLFCFFHLQVPGRRWRRRRWVTMKGCVGHHFPELEGPEQGSPFLDSSCFWRQQAPVFQINATS